MIQAWFHVFCCILMMRLWYFSLRWSIVLRIVDRQVMWHAIVPVYVCVSVIAAYCEVMNSVPHES